MSASQHSYVEALDILARLRISGINPSFDGMRVLLEALGSPENSYASIQIAGTNGKSSTARYIAALLHAAGRKTGLFTSPALVDAEEQIEVNQWVITRDDFAGVICETYDCAHALIERGDLELISEFELLCAATFLHFARSGVDVAVLEVGMGGRWDATSVKDAAVAVITGVACDHQAFLGDTLEEIAFEKAAIIKPRSIVVLGKGTVPVTSIFEQRIIEVDAKDHPLTQTLPPLLEQHFLGYQADNLLCAHAAAEAYLGTTISATALEKAFLATPIPGRLEVVNEDPLIILDAAHNPQSAQTLAAALSAMQPLHSLFPHPATLLLAVLADKDVEGIIAALAPLFTHIVVTQTSSPRALSAKELAVRLASCFKGEISVFRTPEEAYRQLASTNTPFIATGSITLAGEMKGLISRM